MESISRINASLHPADTDKKTYGCRHSNPDICGKHSLVGVCAFVNEDHICYNPPISWRKQFLALIDKENSRLKSDETQ